MKTIGIVFDGPPGPESGRFVEVERNGRSINFGEWVHREDGFWVLRIPDPEKRADLDRPVAERAFTEAESSNIKWLSFNYSANAFDVCFRRYEDIYRYIDVPTELMVEFSKSVAPGAFLAQRIKGNFRFHHVSGD